MNTGSNMSEFYFSETEKLFQKIQKFVSSADREILIISPYIKTEVLEKLLQKKPAKTSIITTWKMRDIQLGISDLDLYTFCKKNGICLYLHPRIHLKAFVNDYSQCVFGSANISRKGFALVADHNYELDAKTETLDTDSVIYFKKILNESILVNDEIYQKYQDTVKKLQPLPELEEPDITSIPKKSEFLISALPMSYDVEELFEIYSNNFKHESLEKRECAIHDIVLFNIPANLEYSKFRRLLKERFLSSKFIEKLLEFVTVEDRYFGEVKEWIQRNCEDVPVPSRRDLTGNIQVLYKWIADLSDGEYKVDRPRHSERLYRVK
jgi:phosphatidylserine/phosphatidylglycerophosphate/cardiolipin synthase-like enzyme